MVTHQMYAQNVNADKSIVLDFLLLHATQFQHHTQVAQHSEDNNYCNQSVIPAYPAEY